MNIKERNEKFYTGEGIRALRNRLKNLIKLFNEDKFPMKNPILGFAFATIQTKEHCKIRIEELSEIVGYPLKIEVISDKIGGREIIIKEEIIYSEKWQ